MVLNIRFKHSSYIHIGIEPISQVPITYQNPNRNICVIQSSAQFDQSFCMHNIYVGIYTIATILHQRTLSILSLGQLFTTFFFSFFTCGTNKESHCKQLEILYLRKFQTVTASPSIHPYETELHV